MAEIPLSEVLLSEGSIGAEPAPDPTGVAVPPQAPPQIEMEGPPTEGSRETAPSYFEMHTPAITPEINYLRDDEIKKQEEAKKLPVSKLDSLSAGLKLHNTISGLIEWGSTVNSMPEFKDLPNHVPNIEGYEDFADNFIQSNSPEEDEWIKSLIDKENSWREDAGITGELFGAITDPIAWGLGAVGAARKAGAMGIIGLETGAAAASEAALQMTQETRALRESAFNVAAAATITSILGGASVYMSKAARQKVENDVNKILNSNDNPPLELDPETGNVVPFRRPGETMGVGAGSTGAMATTGSLEANTMVGGKVSEFFSVGPGSRLLGVDNPKVRELAQKLVDLPFALKKHVEGKTVGASVEAKLGDYTKMWYRSYTTAHDAFKAYRKGGGKLKWTEFDAEVGKAMRKGDLSNIPEVQIAARAWRQAVNEVRDRAIEVGALPANVKVEYADSYFPRAIDFGKSHDIAPLRSAVADYHMRIVGLGENEAWELADLVGQKFSSGNTLPPGIIPIPAASGTKARTISIKDEFLEPYLNSAASDVLMRHFREMGAEIELRRVFGIDAASTNQRAGLIAEREARKQELWEQIRRLELDINDTKLMEKRLHEEEIARSPEEHSVAGGRYRVRVMPGEKLERTEFPASTGKAPIVGDTEKAGAHEINLNLRNPLAIEDFGRFVFEDMGHGVARLQKTLELVTVLKNQRILDSDFIRMVEDLMQQVPRTKRMMSKAEKESLSKEMKWIFRMKLEGGLYDVPGINIKVANAVANRIIRQAFVRIRLKGHDAIMFADKRQNQVGNKYILFEPEKARRAPTPEQKKEWRKSLKATVEKHREMQRVMDEFTKENDALNELIERLPDKTESIHSAVDDFIREVEKDYMSKADAAKTDREKDKIRDELRVLKHDIRAMIGRIQGHFGRPADASSAFVRAGRWLRALTATTQLGGVVFTSIPELARPIFQYGLRPYARGLATMATNIHEMKMARREVNRMGAALEVVTQQRLLNWMGEDGMGMLSNRQVAFEKGVGLYTGLSHWTEAIKSFTGILAVDQISATVAKVAAKTAKPNEIAKLARAGIDESLAIRMAEQFDQYGSKGGNIKMAHADDWADRDAALALEAAIRSEVNMVALEPGMADKWLWTSNEVGKIAGQFMSFAQGATNRAMVSGLQRADTHFYVGLVISTAMGTAVMALKDISVGRDPTEYHPAQVLANSIERSGVLGVWDRAFTMSRSLLGSNNPKFWGEREAVRLMGPTFGRTVPNIFTSIGGLASGNPQWKPMVELTPYNDLFHLRRLAEQTMDVPWEDTK